MSMSAWLQDAQPFPDAENGTFNGASDPSVGYLQNPTPSTYDFNHHPGHQMPYFLNNGNPHNGSPSPHNSMYQTHPTIPSKRPRPREDSAGASPRKYSGTLPQPRTQTPQGVYSSFSGVVNGGAQFPGSGPYSQYPQAGGSTNQSPVMQQQNYNTQMGHQRVQTVSPSPFSPAMHNFGIQNSPSHSEHGSRVNTPQNGTQQYPQGVSFGSGAGQSFTPPAGSTLNGASSSHSIQQPLNQHQHHQQQQQQQQMIHEARMRSMQTANGAPPQQVQPQSSPVSHLGHSMNSVANYPPMSQLRGQQTPQVMQRPSGVDDLSRNIMQYMQQRRMPFDANPIISGRAINSVQLFVGVVKMGGSRRVTTATQWPHVAQLLGLPPMLAASAAQELQIYWDRNLGSYEMFWMQQQQQRQQQQQQHRQQAMANSMGGPPSALGFDRSIRADAFPTSKQINEQMPRPMQPPPPIRTASQTPAKQVPYMGNETQQVLQNGYISSQQGQVSSQRGEIYNVSQDSPTPPHLPSKQHVPAPSANAVSDSSLDDERRGPDFDSHKARPSPWTPRLQELPNFYVPAVNNLDATLKLGPTKAHNALDEAKISSDDVQDALDNTIWATHHGGLPIANPHFNSSVEALLKYKLSIPRIEELGEIDIRAITLSLRSGIHGEVRLALDTIASLSVLPKPPSLDQCDDLVETLVECANDQVEFLAEHATEVSDVIMISSYGETIRCCKVENEIMPDIPEFGTINHELDRSVDKLICITTILRNFSFSQDSHHSLADPMVLRMMATVMRYLGTRNMMLRTHRNALDFSKDVVMFLSQLAYRLDISTKDEANCVVHFLVSFAPLPEPNGNETGAIAFSPYLPSLNTYVPYAVDCMAKLFARNPNRALFRSIFAADMSASSPFDLLTRAFGLAICPVPEGFNLDLVLVIKKRAAFLAQGLLAAEQLISMIPSSEHQLARSWMTSQDGLTAKLMRMTSSLVRCIPAQPPPPPQPQSQHQRHRDATVEHYDPDGFGMIASRGLTVLKKLAERAKDAEGSTAALSCAAQHSKQHVLAALGAPNLSLDLIRQFCTTSGYD